MQQFSTVYNQFLKQIPRGQFQTCVDHYNGDYRVRTFNCWSQFTTMMYAQLTGKASLRALEIGLQNQTHHFYHVGLKKVSRSTVADANQNRDWHIYEELFTTVLLRCQDVSPKHKFRFQNKLQSFDASTIKLCLEMFPWAKFRQAKGAIKLHARLDHSGQIPDFINVTTGKTHEIKVARTLKIEADSISVFDRAMIDYEWLHHIDESDAYFVTRAKDNMSYEVVRKPEHHLPKLSKRARQKGIIKDQIIRIVGNKADNIPIELRLVTYCDPETREVYVYLTNLFHLSALTIAQIYKARWEIELFFKWIKQHLKIKTFLGTTENAVMTQIWIAVITYLLLAYIKYKNKFQSSLLTLQRLICENIFARMHLDQLLFPELRGVGGRHPVPPRNPAQLHLAL
jgi:IS4 transposase